MDKQTILIIDDHPLMRSGLAKLIAGEPCLDLVGEASSGREGVKMVMELQPDLVLLDLNMKEMNGIEVLRAIKEQGFDGRVIMLTVSDHDEDVISALRAGADGYLLKDMEPEEISKALSRAASGHIVIADRLTEMLAIALRDESVPETADEARLTPREIEILNLIAEGLSNKLIARKLDIAEGTVKVHVKHMLKKLHVRSRVEAAVWAIKRGYTGKNPG